MSAPDYRAMAVEEYAKCLQRVERTQNLACECRYVTAPQNVTRMAEAEHEHAKADMTEALKRLNEVLLKDGPR